MRLGIDFDNTIVCYDALFHRVALEGGWIPADLPATKSEVRNHLRRTGHEDVWTEMQGRVYGARMAEAMPYPQILEFFRACRRAEIQVFIISHKTLRPFLGEPHDLHQAALDWLTAHGFFVPAGIGLTRDRVFFEPTKQQKLHRIAACGCSHFIDDLPEFLAEPAFPASVERLLFDPNNLYTDESRFPRLRTWDEAARLLGFGLEGQIQGRTQFPASLILEGPTLAAPAVRDAGDCVRPDEGSVQRLLEACGIVGPYTAEPIPGGANNRVWRVDAGGRALVLKRYFHSPDDPRDRFGAERGFYAWAWGKGIRRTPEPMGWEQGERLGLFEFVSGRKLKSEEMVDAIVDQALTFVTELNAGRDDPAAKALPPASEACFSLAEHLDRIDRRVGRLTSFIPDSDPDSVPEPDPGSSLDREAGILVARELAPAWREIRETIARRADRPLDEVLIPIERCLSPSDFGFHNALLDPEGRLRFFDFEYAGWDDPAKLICDFFCQPQVPVPLAHWRRVVEGLDRVFGGRGVLALRAEILLPAYRIKWCCILLNEFVRSERTRRDFAQGPGDPIERKRVQLAKARRALAALKG